MEILEIFTDLYFALGSAISSISDRLRNYTKLLSRSANGLAGTYKYLRSIHELNDTINHESACKLLVVDQIVAKGVLSSMHCILLNAHGKFVNSLILNVRTASIPADLWNLPQKWNV